MRTLPVPPGAATAAAAVSMPGAHGVAPPASVGAVAEALQSSDKKGTPNASMMRGSGLAELSYNFYQDSVKATIRKEQPGISTDEKEPFEAQAAAAKDVCSQMQAVVKNSRVVAFPAARSTHDGALAASAAPAVAMEVEGVFKNCPTCRQGAFSFLCCCWYGW